jgi:heat shock protein HslJ
MALRIKAFCAAMAFAGCLPVAASAEEILNLIAVDGASPLWPVTLIYTDQGPFIGQGPCNRYSAEISRDGAVLDIGAVHMTEMACMEEARTAADAEFARLLAGMDAVRETDGIVVLTGQGHEMVFARP